MAAIQTETPNRDDLALAVSAKKGSPYLTAKQAAFYLGISPRTLAKWRTKHKGPKYGRAGRSPRYLVRDLDQHIKENPNLYADHSRRFPPCVPPLAP